jgi:anti-sigma B factor antagonist
VERSTTEPGGDVVGPSPAPRLTEDGIYVLAVTSDFDYVHTPHVREKLRGAISAGAHAVIFDLRESEFLDSSGLALLVEGLRALGSGRVALAEVDPHARRVLAMTGLDSRLLICESVDQALLALRASRS